MSKEFYTSSPGGSRAEWFNDGSGVKVHYGGTIHAHDIPAFIEWLQEGPPKPKYRITKTFDREPQYVGFRDHFHFTTDAAFLTDNDIEEIR